jgi:hypothetical protein
MRHAADASGCSRHPPTCEQRRARRRSIRRRRLSRGALWRTGRRANSGRSARKGGVPRPATAHRTTERRARCPTHRRLRGRRSSRACRRTTPRSRLRPPSVGAGLCLTARLGVMLAVIEQMAALAHRPEVVVRAVLRDVIEVRRRQDDLAFCPGRWLPVALFAATAAMQAAFTGALATTARAHEADVTAQRRPVLRVAIAILGADGAHDTDPARTTVPRMYLFAGNPCPLVSRT